MSSQVALKGGFTLDFQKALQELLDAETEPLEDGGLKQQMREQARVWASLHKKQADISLQVDEIYEIIKEDREGEKALEEEKRRCAGLLGALIGLCDILEDFHAFAVSGGDSELARQAFMMWENAGALLEGSGVTRLGQAGQALVPALHTVKAVRASDFPRERVAEVLRSGYLYMGALCRKAAVVVSAGLEGDGRG